MRVEIGANRRAEAEEGFHMQTQQSPDSCQSRDKAVPWRPSWQKLGASLGFYPSKSDGIESDKTAHMTSPLAESLNTMNRIINSPARPQSVAALRQILRERTQTRSKLGRMDNTL
jgi:hypothetical protein